MPFNYHKLSPNIRSTVRWLNDNGFKTTDSGDGSNLRNGMEGALPFPNVFIIVPKCNNLIFEADRLMKMVDDMMRKIVVDIYFRKPVIEASYNPEDGTAVIGLTYLYDRILEHAGISY